MADSDYLQMRQISKSYDGAKALHQLDFSAALGEVHAIVGENGAGKSTLIKILAGAIPMDTGTIYLNGVQVDLHSPQHAFKQGIRPVYQEFSLVNHLSVTENILMGQMPTGRMSWWVDWSTAHLRAQDILVEIGFTGIDVRHTVADLSVSHQQMVEIAKAVAEKPRILILDEPSAVLSQEELTRLFALVRQLKRDNALILYISHRLDEVFEIADRITVLKDGELVGTLETKHTTMHQLIKMMVGRELEDIYPRRKALAGDEALAIKNLGKKGIFSDVSFSLAYGEIVGLFGLVGSGRSDLARCIFGAQPFSNGEMMVDRQTYKPHSPYEALDSGIALVTEDRKRDGLVMNCSIRDNASLATMKQMVRRGFIDRKIQDSMVMLKVHELSIRPPQIQRMVKEMSGGNQQKVVLAKWLLANAKVLILDEPTRGVDVATKVEIYHLIGKLADSGVGILLISSELPEILGMSDRAIVMREGRLVGEFTRAQASEEILLSCAAGVVH